jgi:4-hydroxy-tetrahydrodipicolinate synthase
MNAIEDYVVWTAIVTPMHADGSVDYESLESLLREQAAAGNAVTILGSTGESLNIDDAERKQILEFALSLELDVPYMVGVGGSNLSTQLKWIEYLNTLPVHAYLLVVPLYAKPGVHGQYGWFSALLDAANKPCVLYNVPGRTAQQLAFQTVDMLKDHPRVWGIKEASGSTEDFARYASISPRFQMLSGDDGLLPAFAKLGARGVISVVGNIWPEATQEYARQCIAGTFTDESLWTKAADALFCASNPIPAKALLHDLGRIKTPTLRLPLSIDDMNDITIVREADTAIRQWQLQQ